MKKKVGLILLAAVAVACVAFVFFGGYRTHRFDHLDAQEIDRVDFWFCTGECVTVRSPDEVEQVIDLLQSLQLKPWLPSGKTGYLCHLEFYDDAGEQETVTFSADRIIANGTSYNMKEDYGENFRQLFEELKASS